MSADLKLREAGKLLYFICNNHLNGPAISGCIVCALARRDELLREILGYKLAPSDIKERITNELDGAKHG